MNVECKKFNERNANLNVKCEQSNKMRTYECRIQVNTNLNVECKKFNELNANLNGEYKKSKEMKNVQHKITKLNFGGYLTPYETVVNKELMAVCKWLNANKLTLN